MQFLLTEVQPFSNHAPQFALAANTELTDTAPGDASITYQANFSWPYDAKVWVALNASAVIPTAGTMTSTSVSVLNPKRKFFSGGDVLHFKSTATVTDAGFDLFRVTG